MSFDGLNNFSLPNPNFFGKVNEQIEKGDEVKLSVEWSVDGKSFELFDIEVQHYQPWEDIASAINQKLSAIQGPQNVFIKINVKFTQSRELDDTYYIYAKTIEKKETSMTRYCRSKQTHHFHAKAYNDMQKILQDSYRNEKFDNRSNLLDDFNAFRDYLRKEVDSEDNNKLLQIVEERIDFLQNPEKYDIQKVLGSGGYNKLGGGTRKENLLKAWEIAKESVIGKFSPYNALPVSGKEPEIFNLTLEKESSPYAELKIPNEETPDKKTPGYGTLPSEEPPKENEAA